MAADRSRCEDWRAESGAQQYVILGAGLDSFAWRQSGSVRVFEVDHPATQAWKRSRLEVLGVAEPVQFAALLAEHRFGVVDQAGPGDVESRWALSALAIGNERVVLASNAS